MKEIFACKIYLIPSPTCSRVSCLNGLIEYKVFVYIVEKAVIVAEAVYINVSD